MKPVDDPQNASDGLAVADRVEAVHGQEVDEVRRGDVEEDVLEAEQHCEPETAREVFAELGADEREHQNAKEEAVVLEVDVVDDEEPRRQDDRGGDDKVASFLPACRRRVDEPLQRHEQEHLARNHRCALEDDCGQPVPADRHELDTPVGSNPCRDKSRQHPLEVRKEGRVVQRPLARVLRVPLPHREQRRDREPVAVHIEVRRVVCREEQDLEQRRRHPDVPERVVVSGACSHAWRRTLRSQSPVCCYRLRLLRRHHSVAFPSTKPCCGFLKSSTQQPRLCQNPSVSASFSLCLSLCPHSCRPRQTHVTTPRFFPRVSRAVFSVLGWRFSLSVLPSSPYCTYLSGSRATDRPV